MVYGFGDKKIIWADAGQALTSELIWSILHTQSGSMRRVMRRQKWQCSRSQTVTVDWT
jgi:hypothetical protein